MKSIVLSGNEIKKVPKYKIDELTEGLYIPTLHEDLRLYVDNDNKPVFILCLTYNKVLPFDIEEWSLHSFIEDTNTTAITFNL